MIQSAGTGDDQHARDNLQIGFVRFDVQLRAEIKPGQRYGPRRPPYGNCRRDAEQHRLRHGAANRDDEGGHHCLRVARFEPVQRPRATALGAKIQAFAAPARKTSERSDIVLAVGLLGRKAEAIEGAQPLSGALMRRRPRGSLNPDIL